MDSSILTPETKWGKKSFTMFYSYTADNLESIEDFLKLTSLHFKNFL